MLCIHVAAPYNANGHGVPRIKFPFLPSWPRLVGYQNDCGSNKYILLPRKYPYTSFVAAGSVPCTVPLFTVYISHLCFLGKSCYITYFYA